MTHMKQVKASAWASDGSKTTLFLEPWEHGWNLAMAMLIGSGDTLLGRIRRDLFLLQRESV